MASLFSIRIPFMLNGGGGAGSKRFGIFSSIICCHIARYRQIMDYFFHLSLLLSDENPTRPFGPLSHPMTYPVRTIMGVQKDVQPWRSQDPTFFQHGGKLFVWGLLAFSIICHKPKFVDLRFLPRWFVWRIAPRPMSTVRSEWPHVPDARNGGQFDAVSGHRATLWQVRGHLPMPTDGPSTTTVAAMV